MKPKFRAWDAFNADMFPEKHNDDLLVKFFREINERESGGNRVYIMQYTGIQDKNGADIYDSDIVYAHMTGLYYVVKHGLYANLEIDDIDGPNCYGWYITTEKNEGIKGYFEGESLEGADEFLTVVGNAYEGIKEKPPCGGLPKV